uniref:Uncharacterized protein n=1 Tax=viral metagenome TaxID=1070528 RepID=A0A6H2A3Y6_9ZZZZ
MDEDKKISSEAYEYGLKVLSDYIKRENEMALKYRDHYKDRQAYDYYATKGRHLDTALKTIRENINVFNELVDD